MAAARARGGGSDEGARPHCDGADAGHLAPKARQGTPRRDARAQGAGVEPGDDRGGGALRPLPAAARTAVPTRAAQLKRVQNCLTLCLDEINASLEHRQEGHARAQLLAVSKRLSELLMSAKEALEVTGVLLPEACLRTTPQLSPGSPAELVLHFGIADSELRITAFRVAPTAGEPSREQIADIWSRPPGREGHLYRQNQRWFEVLLVLDASGEHPGLSRLHASISAMVELAAQLQDKLLAFTVET